MASSSTTATGFCYENPSTIQSHFLNQVQGAYEPNQAEIFNMDTRSIHDHYSLMVNRWQDQNSSLRSLFPCEGNERPSQRLSLSLSSTNPSGIELRPFELRHTTPNYQQEQKFWQDGGSIKAANLNQQRPVLLRSSKFLRPLQDLLSEFCNLGTQQSGDGLIKQTSNRDKHQRRGIDEHGSSSSSRKKSLSSIQFMELQDRKTKLLFMLDEVNRRYGHYREQIKAVVLSFEEVAGDGAAEVYTSSASKVISRHFRCLRGGIVSQLHAIEKALGEKHTVAIGTTKGETSKLIIIDQALRRQRALQQLNTMEPLPWRSKRGLPEKSILILRSWLFEHFLHPYPSDVDKHILSRQTGLSRSQVSNWFINARVRFWKPMVEEMYLEETKDQQQELDDASINGGRHNKNNTNPSTEQKPTQNQLMCIESDHGLSSIITSKKVSFDQDYDLQFGSFGGGVELDFGGGGSRVDNGVSLTLGLQQHGGSNDLSIDLSHGINDQSSLFYSKEDGRQIDDGFSLVEGDDENLGDYRNVMGGQWLQDLAG